MSEHQDLIARIMAYDLDCGGATGVFVGRLARENAWSIAYASGVAAEYKRFLVLAITAGHPVSPPNAVDQAWHLHLLHTRAYWDDFCPNVLGRPFHHEPSKGTADESRKFTGWYADTYASYRKTFDQVPPPDIWPAPDDVAKGHHEHVRIDLKQSVVISKRRAALIAAVVLVMLILTAVSTGCALRAV
jgi:hypothetical protein